MKDLRGVSNSSKPSKYLNFNGVKALVIRKDSPEGRILRRIKEYLLYAELRSLIPAQTSETNVVFRKRHLSLRKLCKLNNPMILSALVPTCNLSLKKVGDLYDMDEEAIELNVEPQEFPQRDSEDENGNAPSSPGEDIDQANMHIKEEECQQDHNTEHNVVYESEGEGTTDTFNPSLKIRKADGAILITAIVLKSVSLTSSLFGLLEEEKLDIVYENQYRTETKVVHTIQVKVQPDYDVGVLERKLIKWAGLGL